MRRLTSEVDLFARQACENREASQDTARIKRLVASVRLCERLLDEWHPQLLAVRLQREREGGGEGGREGGREEGREREWASVQSGHNNT